MQAWLVLLYYALLVILCVFSYYVLSIRWWSAFNMSLLITFVVIVFTAPEWVAESSATVDVIFLFLLTVLTVFAPVFVFIYVLSQALMDQVGQVCTVYDN